MADSDEMRANLMRAAGARLGFDQGETSKAQQHAPIRLGGAAVAEPCRHTRAVLRIARDRATDCSGITGQTAMKQGDICLFDCARAELLTKNAMCNIIARYDHGSGGAAVQPVHDSRTKISANCRERSEVMEQSIDQRASRRARSGVNDHSRGLIDRDDVFVLIEHIDRYLFGRRSQRRARQDFYIYGVACHDSLCPAGETFADTDSAIVY
jgi:hypothetical protein